MRQQQPPTGKNTFTHAIINDMRQSGWNINDPLGVMSGYYLEKIEELNSRLDDLNLQENAREISTVCHEIIRAKKALRKLSINCGYLA